VVLSGFVLAYNDVFWGKKVVFWWFFSILARFLMVFAWFFVVFDGFFECFILVLIFAGFWVIFLA